MNRTITFTKRNLLEMLRDPLSYIFCVAFPLVMLVLSLLRLLFACNCSARSLDWRCGRLTELL